MSSQIPTLSIGMIVKNEEKHLRNCLNHLKPILNAIPCELIIADTGSTDSTIEIARAFTDCDKILQIEWNNNFAEARNHTVHAAKGEWYMFLDADEYFEDTVDLIRFFVSGEYKNFKTATYQVRDYHADNSGYRAAILRRLCVLTPETAFKGFVHENLPAWQPSFNINSYVRHHGYIDDVSPDLIKQKLLRNLPMLEREHDENPDALNPVKYLAYSYLDLGETKKAFDYLEKTMRLGASSPKQAMFQTLHYMAAVFYAKSKTPEGYRKAIAIIDKCLAESTYRSLAALDMYSNKGDYHSALEEYGNAAKAFEASYQLMQLYFSNKLDMCDAGLHTSEHANEIGLWLLTVNLAYCYAHLNNAAAAFEWAARTPMTIVKTIDIYFSLMNQTGQFWRVKELFDRIAWLQNSPNTVETMDKLLARFDEIVLKNPQAAVILQPFFDSYVTIIYEYLQRKKMSLEYMHPIHQVAHHLHLADTCKKQGNESNALKHIEAAIKADSRFTALIQGR